jgi:hypothetical protein
MSKGGDSPSMNWSSEEEEENNGDDVDWNKFKSQLSEAEKSAMLKLVAVDDHTSNTISTNTNSTNTNSTNTNSTNTNSTNTNSNTTNSNTTNSNTTNSNTTNSNTTNSNTTNSNTTNSTNTNESLVNVNNTTTISKAYPFPAPFQSPKFNGFHHNTLMNETSTNTNANPFNFVHVNDNPFHLETTIGMETSKEQVQNRNHLLLQSRKTSKNTKIKVKAKAIKPEEGFHFSPELLNSIANLPFNVVDAVSSHWATTDKPMGHNDGVDKSKLVVASPAKVRKQVLENKPSPPLLEEKKMEMKQKDNISPSTSSSRNRSPHKYTHSTTTNIEDMETINKFKQTKEIEEKKKRMESIIQQLTMKYIICTKDEKVAAQKILTMQYNGRIYFIIDRLLDMTMIKNEEDESKQIMVVENRLEQEHEIYGLIYKQKHEDEKMKETTLFRWKMSCWLSMTLLFFMVTLNPSHFCIDI